MFNFILQVKNHKLLPLQVIKGTRENGNKIQMQLSVYFRT